MSKKSEEAKTPGWGEVILGAALSLVLGVVLGAAVLLLKPVTTAKELPKETVAGAVYFLEGSRDSAKAKQIVAKRKAFGSGVAGTISFNEDELNALVAPAAAAPAPAKGKPGEKPADKPAEAPATTGVNAGGAPNFRIRDGMLQIGVPAKLSLFGIEQSLLVQARGTLVKQAGGFVFEPASMLVGACPVGRLPGATAFVMNKVFKTIPVPDDIAGGWSKLADVAIEGGVLKLTMQ